MKYDPALTVERIREIASKKGIKMSELSESCGKGANIISQSAKSKEGMRASNLVTIADYLHTSADYLLGRSDNPDDFSNELREIKHILESLSVRGRAELMTMIFDFSDKEG